MWALFEERGRSCVWCSGFITSRLTTVWERDHLLRQFKVALSTMLLFVSHSWYFWDGRDLLYLCSSFFFLWLSFPSWPAFPLKRHYFLCDFSYCFSPLLSLPLSPYRCCSRKVHCVPLSRNMQTQMYLRGLFLHVSSFLQLKRQCQQFLVLVLEQSGHVFSLPTNYTRNVWRLWNNISKKRHFVPSLYEPQLHVPFFLVIQLSSCMQKQTSSQSIKPRKQGTSSNNGGFFCNYNLIVMTMHEQKSIQLHLQHPNSIMDMR